MGQIKNILSFILQSTCYFLCGLHNGCGSLGYVFSRENAEVVGEWLERNNLSIQNNK